MKKIIASIMIALSIVSAKAEDHYLYQVEKWASIYLVESKHCPLDTIYLDNGKVLKVFSNDYKPLHEAYDILTLYLNMSYRSYEDRSECVADWKCIQPVVDVLTSDFDGLCSEVFCLEFSREEYLDAVDYLFENFSIK